MDLATPWYYNTALRIEENVNRNNPPTTTIIIVYFLFL